MRTLRAHWRPVVAALPLPMLALAASYGVYSFALLFVPAWVAITQAAAFELTYIGLAVVRTLSAGQRRRASAISVGAVVVSVVYNSLAGLFHRRPELLIDLPIWAEAILAVLHGLPLAWVAYLVADLLLHQEAAGDRPDRALTPQIAADVALGGADQARNGPGNIAPDPTLVDLLALPAAESAAAPARVYTCRHCGAQNLTAAELMTHGRRAKRYGVCAPLASAAD